MIRTFLAGEIGEGLCREIARLQQRLREQLTANLPRKVRIQWVPASHIHLTFKFLGNTDERSVEPLRDAVSHRIASHHTVHIPLERLGAFPRLEQPRVLWVGPSEQWQRSEDAGRLAGLQDDIEECCRTCGFAPEERPFSPHLTLARIKEGERQVGQGLSGSGVLDHPRSLGTLPIDGLVLMKSELRSTGPVYTKLWEVRLTPLKENREP